MANAVTRITIEATPDSGAMVAYQNPDGTALTDADMNTAGQQLELLAVGARRINVVVTRGTETQALHGAAGSPGDRRRRSAVCGSGPVRR